MNLETVVTCHASRLSIPFFLGLVNESCIICVLLGCLRILTVLFPIYEAISGVVEACENAGLPVASSQCLNPHAASLEFRCG